MTSQPAPEQLDRAIGEIAATFCLRCRLGLDTHLFFSLIAEDAANLLHNAIKLGHMDVSITVSRSHNDQNQLISLPPSFPSLSPTNFEHLLCVRTFQELGTKQG